MAYRAAWREHPLRVGRELSWRVSISLQRTASTHAHGNGTWDGVVVVSPRNGFPTDKDVSREYVVIQSEYYLKPAEGGLHVLDFDAAMAKRPSQVAFNGHTSALTAAPLVANAGERVRFTYQNVGPSDGSSFHVVGAIFDRVFYEGNPRNEWSGLQKSHSAPATAALLNSSRRRKAPTCSKTMSRPTRSVAPSDI